MFEDTLRELKSSVVAIHQDRLDFINPSVQDFLAGEAFGPSVVGTIAAAAPRWKSIVHIWKILRDGAHAVPYSSKRELNERLDQIDQAEKASLGRSAASAGHPTSALPCPRARPV